ncbi:MAG: T9SS type A sorting domain-containing protein [Bacteroidetes bacterium]|nr:T9SS type A sorting domain-containing protein [Bacteroidota bacterium]
MKNSCGFGDSVIYLHRVTIAPPTEISYTCAGYATSCTTGSLPGYKLYAYVGNVTLYQRCDHWTFSVSEGPRDPSILNISTITSNVYVEATLNNLDYQGNSGPYFTLYAPFVFWDSVGTSKSNQAFDPNGDSVGFEIITPMTGTASSPVNASYNPDYSLPNNPFSTHNTFEYIPDLETMFFTPYGAGKYIVTTRVSDYKKISKSGIVSWVKLGSVMKDEQIIVLEKPKPGMTFSLDTSSITGGTLINGAINVCSNAFLHFCINMRTKSTYVNFTVNGFYLDTMPKLYLTHYTTDSASACVTFPISSIPPDAFEFYFSLPDTVCSNGFTEDYLWRVPVKVKQSAEGVEDKLFICIGDTMRITGYGDSLGTYIWGVLPGGAPITSLSCTTCTSTKAAPGVTTTDTLYTPDNLTCKNRDTFTVVVRNRPATPIAGSNAPICSDDTLRLSLIDTGTVIARRWTGPGGYRSILKNPKIFPASSGVYKAYDSSNGCASYADSVTVLVKPKPNMPLVSSNSPICLHDSLQLHAVDTAGVSYYWRSPDTTVLYIVPNPVIPFAEAGVYKSYVVLNGCTSDTARLNVEVDSVGPPVVSVASNPDTVIPGFNMTFRAIVSNAGSKPSYQWRKNGVNIPGATTNMLITNDIKERDIVSVVVHSSLRCALPDSGIVGTWPLTTEDINLNGNNVAVYPNPNAGNFIVKGKVANTSSQVSMEIMNMLGAVVYSNSLPVSNGNFYATVNLDNIAKGVYVIRLKADNAVFFTKFSLQK